jgi:hypothetical protein
MEVIGQFQVPAAYTREKGLRANLNVVAKWKFLPFPGPETLLSSS